MVHISRANGVEITRDKSDNVHTKFLASNVHFNYLSFDLLGSRSLLYGGLKFGYFFKGGRLYSDTGHSTVRACCSKQSIGRSPKLIPKRPPHRTLIWSTKCDDTNKRTDRQTNGFYSTEVIEME